MCPLSLAFSGIVPGGKLLLGRKRGKEGLKITYVLLRERTPFSKVSDPS